MQRLVLTRKTQSDQGTFGRLDLPAAPSGEALFTLCTAELPWQGNRRGLSRILPGIYRCVPYSSAKYSDVWQLLAVPGREAILIHSGNFAGDQAKGFKSDVAGCILVGLQLGVMDGQRAVLQSRAALDLLRQALGRREFELEIAEAFAPDLEQTPQSKPGQAAEPENFLRNRLNGLHRQV